MTFVSGYRMIFNVLKLEQIYNWIICNTIVLSSTIIIVSKNDRVWPRNAIITDCRPTHGTVRKGYKVGIIQLLQYNIYVYFKFLFLSIWISYAQIRLRFAWIFAQPY